MQTDITMTARATAHFKQLLGSKTELRLQTNKSGCSGLKYDIKIDQGFEPGDKTFNLDGITLYVDLESFAHLKGTEIDFVQTNNLNTELRFNNPNVKHSCGCGESFGT